MSRHPVDAEDPSGRDWQILHFLADVGVAGARQIEQLAFPVGSGTPLSAARRCRRVLARLHQDGYLLRLERRMGGVRAGSAGYLYQLGTRGKRALDLPGRGRTWEPGGRFVAHALAVAQVHVDLSETERLGRIRDLRITHEPDCWRRFMSAHGLQTLKPDLLCEFTTGSATGDQSWELRWFIEVDRGTEHLPTVLRKAQLYEQYWRSGHEAQHHDVFPRVLWSVPDEHRAQSIRGAIGRSRTLTDQLFRVATAAQTTTVLTGSETAQRTEEAINQQREEVNHEHEKH